MRALHLILAALVASVAAAHAGERPPARSLLEMRQEGVVIQAWDLSCGAAAIATVLTHDFGDEVAEVDVATSMLDGKDPTQIHAQGGFSLLDMKRFLEDRGYEAKGLGNLTAASLAERLPAIVPTTRNGVSHFVVVRAITRGRALIADPAFGTYSMRLDRFAEIWTSGIALAARAPGAQATNGTSLQTAVHPRASIIRQNW